MGLRVFIAAGLILFGSTLFTSKAQSQQARPREKHALLIGISDYGAAGGGTGDSIRSLEFADEDLDGLEKVLKSQDWVVTVLKNARAKRGDILWQLADYNRRLNENDTVLIYFAGHGVRNGRGRTYWVAYDTGPAMLDYQGIRMKHALEIIADLPPKTKIVLLDHCFAGNLEFDRALPATGDSRGPAAGEVSPGFRITASQDPKAAEERARGVLEEDVKSANVAGEHMVVIGAARGAAFEPTDLQHGLFTYYLLDALNSSRADAPPQDGQLSVIELVTYLKAKMTEYAHAKGFTQSPLVAPADGDFTEFASLKLFSLKPLQGTKQRYLAKLASWAQDSKKWVLEETLNQLQEILSRWVEAQMGTPANRPLLTEGERSLITALAGAVDGNVPADEKGRAEIFEAKAAALRTPQ